MKENYYRGLLFPKEQAEVFITGIAYDNGCSCGKGAAKAPEKIRELSAFLPPFSMDGDNLQEIKLYDNGIIAVNNLEEISNLTKHLFTDSHFNIFIGGDHSISIPLQRHFIKKAIAKNKVPVIIHLDAHPDICDIYDGTKLSHACTNMRAIDEGLKPENLIIIGTRGYEEQEIRYFKLHPELTVYSASYLNKNGPNLMLNEIFGRFDDNHEIYLSYDIDVNDPAYAPGTGTPEAFGLSSQMVLKIIISLIENLPIVNFDLVEVSPVLDNNNITSWLALKTLYEVFNVLIKKDIK